MAAKWRRCQKCRKVLSEDAFDGEAEICRADEAKAAATPATSRTSSTVTTRVVAPPAGRRGPAVADLRGRGDTEVRARRARVRALERLAERFAEDFELILREERSSEGL